jgi:hypothetical protein
MSLVAKPQVAANLLSSQFTAFEKQSHMRGRTADFISSLLCRDQIFV